MAINWIDNIADIVLVPAKIVSDPERFLLNICDTIVDLPNVPDHIWTWLLEYQHLDKNTRAEKIGRLFANDLTLALPANKILRLPKIKITTSVAQKIGKLVEQSILRKLSKKIHRGTSKN